MFKDTSLETFLKTQLIQMFKNFFSKYYYVYPIN